MAERPNGSGPTNRVDRAFAQARERGEGVLIPLIPPSRPPFARSFAVADMLAEAGADIFEVAIPSRYPWMEGRTMQSHQLQALRDGVSASHAFELMDELRSRHPDWPLVTINFTCALVSLGIERYVARCAAAAIDAVDVPDYPLTAGEDPLGFGADLRAENIHFLACVSTQMARSAPGSAEHQLLVALLREARGLVFLIAQPGGQSGAKKTMPISELSEGTAALRALERELRVDVPIIVVCGVSQPEHVHAAVTTIGADGVMLGSAVSERLLADEPLTEVGRFVTQLKAATRP